MLQMGALGTRDSFPLPEQDMITARYTCNLENLRRGCETYWTTLRYVKLTPLLGIIFIAAAVYGVTVTHKIQWADSLYGIGLGLLFLSLRKLTIWQLGRSIERSPQYGTEVNYAFDQEEIVHFGEEHHFTFLWKQLSLAKVTHDGVLLCLGKNVFHWIPSTAFEGPDDMKTIERYLKENGVPSKSA
jgi:hypothetical protein